MVPALSFSSGIRPLCLEPDGALLHYRDGVLSRRDPSAGETVVARLERSHLQVACEGIPWLQRLLRLGMHELIELSDGSLLGTAAGKLIRLAPGETVFQTVFVLPRGSRPLRLCATPDGWVFFGEYWRNPERQHVDIFGSPDGGQSWQRLYRFPAGQIRHIHGIFYDSFRQGCWVLTGDEDAECKIMFSSDRFNHLEQVFAGSQEFRSVYLFPREQGLITATDTPFQANFIHWLEPESGRHQTVQAVEGSVLYGATAGQYMVLSTLVEPSKANPSREAVIWISRDGYHWRRLAAYTKDFIAGRYFQYASFQFPRGENLSQRLYAYGQGLAHGTGLYCWDLDQAWDQLA